MKHRSRAIAAKIKKVQFLRLQYFDLPGKIIVMLNIKTDIRQQKRIDEDAVDHHMSQVSNRKRHCVSFIV